MGESARYKDLKSQPYVSGDEQLSWCKDDEKVMQANPNTDTTRCKYTRMPDCSKDVVCSVSSGLQASSAVFVSIVALCSYMFAGLAYVIASAGFLFASLASAAARSTKNRNGEFVSMLMAYDSYDDICSCIKLPDSCLITINCSVHK